MSIEIFDDTKEGESIVEKANSELLSINEIFKRKKKRRRGYPRRLLKKWLKTREKQNNIIPFPAKGSITSFRSPVEKFRKAGF